MRRSVRVAVVVVSLALVAVILHGALPVPQTGVWQGVGALAGSSTGAAAVQLQDGSVLISGGTGDSGALATAQIFGADGSIAPTGNLNEPRSQHTAVLLGDGRVLVAGGSTTSGPTNSAEIYDPASKSWSLTKSAMTSARSGHTATVLADGRVLIAGGVTTTGASNSLEIFDPASGLFSPVAVTMSTPRANHAAALLSDGRVLLIGGNDGANALASVDSFDPSAGTIVAANSLSVARSKATATVLLNGNVAVIGGNNGQADQASAEVYSTAAGSWSMVPGGQPRSGHIALLLKDNYSVLVFGGSIPQDASADLLTVNAGSGAASFVSTGASATSHSGGIGSGIGVAGLVLGAGGSGGAGAEVYGFATATTDASDYAPGTPVYVSGTGFQPGELVDITMIESPLIDSHGPYTVTADSNGGISDHSFTPDEHDVNVRFYMFVQGRNSGTVAQNTFTDAPPPAKTSAITTSTFTRRAGACSPQITVHAAQGTATSGISYTLTSSSTSATFYTDSTCTTSTTSVTTGTTGDASFYYKDPKAGTPTISANGGSGYPTATQTETITISHFSVTGFPSPATQNVSGSFTVTALDETGTGAVASYRGTVHITSSDGSATLPGNYTFTSGDSGAHSLSATLATAGTQSITATDTTSSQITGSQTGIVVDFQSTTKLSSSLNPSNLGDSVTFSVNVSATNPPQGQQAKPSGTVTFTVDGQAFDTQTLNNGGGATSIATTTLTAGDHTVVASYAGDTNYAASSDTITQKVNATGTPTITVSPVTGNYGSTVTLSATFGAVGACTTINGQSIAFTLNGNNVGSGTTNSSGVASVTNVSLGTIAVGSYSTAIGASYTASGACNAASGSGSLTVNKTTTSVTSAPESVTYNPAAQSVPVSATVTSAGGTVNNGTVTFTITDTTTSTQVGTASANVSSGSASTNVTITAGATAADTYQISAAYAGGTGSNFADNSGTSALTINKADQANFALTAGSPLTYNTNEQLSTTGGNGTGAVSYSVTSGSCAITGTSNDQLTANSGTGTCGVGATKAADANYKQATASATVTLQKADQTNFALTAGSPLTYNTNEQLSTTGGNGTGAVSYSVTSGSCTITGAALDQLTANSGTGTCGVSATKAADDNYKSATASANVTLQKADQATLTFGPGSPLTYNTTEALSTGGGSGTGAVSYSVTSGSCAITGTSNDQLTANSGTGTCGVSATKAADDNYKSATATASVTLQKANQSTLTLNAGSPLTYNTTETLTISGGSGVGTVSYSLTSGSCQLSADQLTAKSGTGSCALGVTKAADDNYNQATATASVTLQKADQATLTLNAGSPLTYNTTETLTISGGSGVGTVSYSLTSGSCQLAADQLTAKSGTGSCALGVTKAADDNYNQATATASVTLQKADQATLTLNAGASLTYNTTEQLSTTGGSGIGAVSYSVTSGSCTITGAANDQLTANSGTGTCGVSATKASDDNYKSATATASVTLQKADQATLTFSPGSPLTYNTTEPLSTGGGSGIGTVSYLVTSGSCAITGTANDQLTANSGTGSCGVSATKASDDNYKSATATASVTLQKANQTTAVTVTGPSDVTYGTPAAASATGGDSNGAYSFSAGSSTGCSILSGSVSVSDATGSCAITAKRLGDTNYNDSPSSASFPVTLHKANATIVVNGYTNYYDGLSHGASGSATGVNGEDLSSLMNYGATYKNVPGGTANWTFAGNNNYNAASGGPVSITINAKPVTVVTQDASKYYQQPDPSPLTTADLSGFIASDNVKASFSRATGEAVGTYHITTTLSGPTALTLSNYTITNPGATFTISKDVTVLSLTGPSKVMYGNCGAGTYSAVLTNLSLNNAPISGQPITFNIGSQTATAVTDATGTASIILTLNQNIGTIQAQAGFAGNSTLSTVLSNSLSIEIVQGLAGPMPGQTIYTGPMLVWTSSTSSNTASVTLSATIQDTAQCGGDIRTAKVTFAFRNGNGTYTPIPSAQNLSVGLVSPTDPTTGTASAIVQLSTGNGTYTQYDIAVIIGGNYLVNDTQYDQFITVAQPGVANSMVGDGTVNLGASPKSAGFLAQALEPGADGYLKVAAAVQYNKSFTNPQGNVQLTFNSYNKPDGTVDSTLHTYMIKSTSISSLTSPASGVLSFTAKSVVQDITNPAAIVSVDGGATMQVVTNSNATTGAPNGTVNIEVQPKAGGLWIAAGWNGTQPQPKAVVSGAIAGK